MPSKPGYIVMGKEVPISFRKKFKKPKDMWYKLGQLFVALAGHLTPKELDAIRLEFKDALEFVEEYL